jgi:hypothetical protein
MFEVERFLPSLNWDQIVPIRWQFDEFEVDIRDSSHCHDEVYIFTDTETKGPFCGFDDAFAYVDSENYDYYYDELLNTHNLGDYARSTEQSYPIRIGIKTGSHVNNFGFKFSWNYTEPEPVECTGEEKFTDSIITCDPNALTLQVPKCAFESINFDWSKAYLAGPDKTPQLDGNDLNPCTGVENGNEIVFSILDDIKSCGTDVINNGTHFIYSNAVQGSIGMSNSVISRTRHVKLDYECAFKNLFILTYGTAINTQLSTIDVTIDSVIGHFDIAFSLFTDDTFEFPIQGVKEFNVPELMHIGATLNTDEERLKLQLQECWATPSSNSESNTKLLEGVAQHSCN